jgi:exosortase/archaeosortase family protein
MQDALAKPRKRRPKSPPYRRVWISVLAAACAAALLIWIAGNETVMGGVQHALARVTGGLLHVLGHRTVVAGSTVSSDLFGITVVTACTGLFTTGLFLIAVVAYPTGWRSKLIGAGLGVTGIFLLNVVRLVSLYYIGVHLPGFLDPAHQLIWQSVLIVFAVALWLLWAGRWAHEPNRA